jgi:hypothetical protein
MGNGGDTRVDCGEKGEAKRRRRRRLLLVGAAATAAWSVSGTWYPGYEPQAVFFIAFHVNISLNARD